MPTYKSHAELERSHYQALRIPEYRQEGLRIVEMEEGLLDAPVSGESPDYHELWDEVDELRLRLKSLEARQPRRTADPF